MGRGDPAGQAGRRRGAVPQYMVEGNRRQRRVFPIIALGATPPLQSTYLLRLRCAGAPAGISRASRLRRGAACYKPSSYRNSKSPYRYAPRWRALEWTADDHLRHSRFVALLEDKRPRDVTRER